MYGRHRLLQASQWILATVEGQVSIHDRPKNPLQPRRTLGEARRHLVLQTTAIAEEPQLHSAVQSIRSFQKRRYRLRRWGIAIPPRAIFFLTRYTSESTQLGVVPKIRWEISRLLNPSRKAR